MISQHRKQGTDQALHESSSSFRSPLASPMTNPSSSSPLHDDDSGWAISLGKDIRFTRNPHPIYLSCIIYGSISGQRIYLDIWS